MDVAALTVQNPLPVSPRPLTRPDTIPAVDSVNPSANLTQDGTGSREQQSLSQDKESPAREPVVERSVTIDPDTQSLVYQALNARGDVVLQVPDQAILRQRAYDREVAHAEERASPSQHVALSA